MPDATTLLEADLNFPYLLAIHMHMLDLSFGSPLYIPLGRSHVVVEGML